MALPYGWDALASMAGGRVIQSGAPPAGRFVVDSRSVAPGDVFVALKGRRRDGHDFLGEAFDRGAGGCLVARRPDRVPPGAAVLEVTDPLRGLQSLARAHRERCSAVVIGITGSNGKTTTKEMLAHLLRSGGKRVLATAGNLNSQVGLPLTLLELESAHTHAVIEMGASSRGEIARLADIARPRLGILTGIGRAHLEFFIDLDGVAAAKWELVEALPEDGIAFLNADDSRLMVRRASARCSVVLFGTGAEADVRAENIRQEPLAAFDLVLGNARREVRLPVPGLFNVANALAAAAVAVWERVPLQTLAAALGSFTPPPARMQVRRRGDGTIFVLDAYNANPDSMAAGLHSFVQAYPERPRCVVLGGMRELGDQAEPAHRELGALLASLSLGRAFFLGPEARWVEDGFKKAAGGFPLVATEDRAALMRELERTLDPGTAVFFKGSRAARLEDLHDPLLQMNGKA